MYITLDASPELPEPLPKKRRVTTAGASAPSPITQALPISSITPTAPAARPPTAREAIVLWERQQQILLHN
eukprot:IDg21289t1